MRIPWRYFAEFRQAVDKATAIEAQQSIAAPAHSCPRTRQIFGGGAAMIFLKSTAKRHSDNGQDVSRRSRRIVTYPPPSTGTNYNLIDNVEHDAGDRIIWHTIHSPDGDFVYDYDLIRQNKQDIERMCLDCHRVKMPGIKRLCNACAKTRKRASNRRSQFKRRLSVRKTGFSSLRAEALTKAVPTSRYVDTGRIDAGTRSHK